MSEITLWNDFSSGWTPSDSHLNGRKNGLPAMDNLTLDENGVLSLSGGTSVILTWPSAAVGIFSKTLNGVKLRYGALANGGIYRNSTLIATASASLGLAGFGAGYGYVFICAGNKRIRDDGTTVSNLYVSAPTLAPEISGAPGEDVEVTGNYSLYTIVNAEGTLVSSSVSQYNIDTSATTFRAVIQSPSALMDTMALSGGAKGTEDDVFTLPFQCEEPSQLSSVTVQFFLEASPGVDDYFTYTWNNSGTDNPFNQSFNSWSLLQAKRKDFERKGTGISDGFSSVYVVRITAVAVSEISLAFFDAFFVGGTLGNLTGAYQWMQVNVNRNGSFVTRSSLGPASVSLTVNAAGVEITPIDPTIGGGTEGWIYRKGGDLGETWYLTKVVTSVATFVDENTDSALLQPLVPTYDLNTSTISPTDLVDAIFAVVGPVEGRMIYFTFKEIIFSEQDSPGTYNIQQVRSYSGELGEKFLWAVQTSEQVVMVGTSKDIYALTGTFATLPDGFIDVYLRSLGVSSPPISFDACKAPGGVAHMSADGWRITSANGQSQLITGINTDLLFKGKARYGYSPTVISLFGTVRYSVALAKSILYCVNPTDLVGGRYVQAYDLIRQYWRPVFLNPSLVASEEDDNLIGFWGDDSKLRNAALSSSKLLDGDTRQQVRLISPIFTGGSLRARKDLFTIKLNIFTGNENVTLTVFYANGTTDVFTIATASLQTVTLNLAGVVNLWWYFQITGACIDFSLADISIDGDVRPIPLTYLRIPPSNYGSHARKRLPTQPFVIDTLGNNVNVTCIRDGSSTGSIVVNSTFPKTFEYPFITDVTGIDYEWRVQQQTAVPFEWFGLMQPKTLQVLPELTKYLRIEETNFGSNGFKEVTSWPVEIACLGSPVTFTVYADGVIVGAIECTGTEKRTYTLYFNPPVSGTDFYADFSGAQRFEVYSTGTNLVKMSYASKKPSLFTQIGPLQLFRYGKIKAFEFRLRATGTLAAISFTFDNLAPTVFTKTTTPDVELAYVVSVPKTLAGSILTVTFDTGNTPHYFEVCRILHTISGNQTDERWSPWNGN